MGEKTDSSSLQPKQKLTRLSLRKLKQDAAIDYAVIYLPESSSYEEALQLAHEVFRLSDSKILLENTELRYPISKEGSSYQRNWARILPREWPIILEMKPDELGVFICNNESESSGDNEKSSTEASETKEKEKETQVVKIMHFFSLKEGLNVEDQRFVVPLAKSYEECVTAAYQCFSSIPRVQCTDRSSIVILGTFAPIKPDDPPVYGRLTPDIYETYIATENNEIPVALITW